MPEKTPETTPPSAGAPAPATAPAQPPAAAAPGADAAPGSAQELAEARRQAAENHDRCLRIAADLENYRRRVTREKEELRQFAATGLVTELLPVLDHLNLALAAAKDPASTGSLADGVALVLDQFRGALSRCGVTEINPEGAAFDPHLHECVSHLPHATVPDGVVLQVIRRGYTLNGRLIRPATVVVSSGPPAPEAAPKA